MKFRWKLMILLLALSILPIVGLRTFGIHNVHLMADALTRRVEQAQMDEASGLLRQLLNSYMQSIAKIREQIEMALFIQAFELERSLNAPASSLQAVAENPEPTDSGAFPPSLGMAPAAFEMKNQTRFCAISPRALPPEKVREDLNRLSLMEPVIQTVSRHLGRLSLRHYSGLPNGVAIAYPCLDAAESQSGALQAVWYRQAFKEKPSHWSRPYTDPLSRKPVTAVSLALEQGEEEQVVGVTSIVVPFDSILESLIPTADLPGNTRTFLCTLALHSAGAGAQILVQAGQSDVNEGMEDPESNRLWLISTDADQLALFLEDIAARRSQIRRMDFKGRDSFWCYGPLPHQGTALVFIVPAEEILKPSQKIRGAIADRVHRVEQLTAGFLVLLVGLNAGLAVIFARSVTRPLERLTEASRKLAKGDFKARVAVRSRDEFGDLGLVFNQVGPQLESHLRMRQSLDVAMQIQYNLLPQSAPKVRGLDVRGMTFYSEETGGDYFDYLCVAEKGRQSLCIAVGDVSDHGLPSALLMATARGFIRQRVALPGRLEEIATDINQRFTEDVERSGRFMTLFLARIDREQNKIEWVRAGHDPALLYDPTTEVFVSLKGKGLPLGVDAAIPYRESSITVEDGQVLFIGTDGIWETGNAGGELFGKDRLKDVIRQHAGRSARDILLAVHAAVEDFRGEWKQEDDLTIVIVKLIAD